jgi:hypothetical protein
MIRRTTNLTAPPINKPPPAIRGTEDLNVMEIANRLRADKDADVAEVLLQAMGVLPHICKLHRGDKGIDLPRAPAMAFLFLRMFQTSSWDACIELLMLTDFPLDADATVRKLLAYEMVASRASETQRRKYERHEQTASFESLKAAHMEAGKPADKAEEIAAKWANRATDSPATAAALRKRVERQRTRARREAATFRAKKAELMRQGKSERDAKELAAAATCNASVADARWLIEVLKAHYGKGASSPGQL